VKKQYISTSQNTGNSKRFKLLLAGLMVLMTAALSSGRIIFAGHYSDWANVENAGAANTPAPSAANDGCPIEAPDGLSLYLASNRTGTQGMNDIWVARRESKEDPWGTAYPLPSPVNSIYNDYCPTPVRGQGLFFVSTRPSDINGVGCGGPDIYFTRQEKDGSWLEPVNLGCGINSAAEEWSPSFFEDSQGNEILYFASTRPGGYDEDPGPSGDADIYYSVNFGPAQLAPGLNTEFEDQRPNVNKTGLEIVFDSNRPGYVGPTPNQDIWTATRGSTLDDWNAPQHLPEPINSSASESRASISWDGLRLYFGSSRLFNGTSVGNDIYFATRENVKGKFD
jgi:hypothetical protein